MTWLVRYLRSSIGKKQLLALTGLGLVGFLVAHLAGNLLLFVGKQKFNEYSHALVSNPLIYAAEAGLAGLFLVHLGLAVKLTLENKDARPVGYAVVRSRGGPSRRSLASQSMIYSGALVLAFLVLHLFTFKFGEYREVVHSGVAMRDMHWLVIKAFKNPLYIAWYVLSMAVLGLHLSHAIASIFTTFGLESPSYTPAVRRASLAFGWALAAGFGLIPVLVAALDIRSL
jgi:succinate dehydrogenase / fumarate reductase cytochrome b subunit